MRRLLIAIMLSFIYFAPSARAAVVRVPAPPPPVRIVIDTDSRRLTVMSQDRPYASFPVAVGRPTLPTPHGHFAVQNKAHWGGGFGTRWVQLSVPWGIYGFHGTSAPGSVGSYASHGCIRMYNRNVETVYEWVQPGTSVDIVGSPSRRRMLEGERGSEIVEVKARMRGLGLYSGPVDGFFTVDLKHAIEAFQQKHSLKPDGAIGKKTYQALGLWPGGLVTYQMRAQGS